MAQKPEAHPTHTQNEYIVAAVTGAGLFLGITVGLLDAFGTQEDFLGQSLTTYLYIAIGLVMIGAALWLALLRPWENFDDLKTPYYTGHDHDDDHHADAPTVTPDDLEIIEGLGPKAKDALVAAGITTFAQVADASGDSLKSVLQAAKLNLGLMKPDTWPRQARFIVAGDVEAFDAYKHELRAGVDITPDDLTVIEGIGPKAQEVLAAAGFATYKAVAAASVSDLQAALDAAGSRMRILKPDTWPKQAQYIVDGDAAGLEAYQSKLRGGVAPDA